MSGPVVTGGVWGGLVDAAPARAHCRKLVDAGMRPAEIARAAGVHRDVVHRLLCEYVTGDTAEKILAITPPEPGARRTPAPRRRPEPVTLPLPTDSSLGVAS